MGRGHEPVSARQLSKLLGQLYDTAYRLDGWESFLKRLAELLGMQMIAISSCPDGTARGQAPKALLGASFGADPAFLESYDYYGKLNPFVHTAPSRQLGYVGPSDAAVPFGELARTEYYNDWLRPQGAGRGLGAYFARERGQILVLGGHLPQGVEVESWRLELMELLIPHLRTAYEVYKRVSAGDRERRLRSLVTDTSQIGVVLVDERGELTVHNEAARALLALDDGLRLDAGSRGLAAGDRRIGRELERQMLRVVEGAHDAEPAQGALLRVPRPSGRRPFEVLIAPLPTSGRSSPMVSPELAACLMINDLDAGSVEADDRLRQLFGLTAAEAEVAGMLLRGLTPKEIAWEREVSVTTVRTQIRTLMARTDTDRQVDLVRVLLTSLAGLRAASGPRGDGRPHQS